MLLKTFQKLQKASASPLNLPTIFKNCQKSIATFSSSLNNSQYDMATKIKLNNLKNAFYTNKGNFENLLNTFFMHYIFIAKMSYLLLFCTKKKVTNLVFGGSYWMPSPLNLLLRFNLNLNRIHQTIFFKSTSLV